MTTLGHNVTRSTTPQPVSLDDFADALRAAFEPFAAAVRQVWSALSGAVPDAQCWRTR